MNYSTHLIARFVERFPDKLVEKQANVVTVHQYFSKAVENRNIVNNTNFIVYMLEKYGDCDCKFFEHGNDMVFIVRGQNVVTVIDRRVVPAGSPFRLASKSAFRKK